MASVFLYTPGGKGRRLAETLEATRLKKFDGMDFWDKRTRIDLPTDAIIVNWARTQLDLDGPRLLNGGSYHTENVSQIMRHLYNSGIKTIPASFHKGPKPSGGSSSLQRWLGRRWDDTFHPTNQPVIGLCWARWMDLKREYRLHMFNGRCIKSGEKVIQEGFTVAKSEHVWTPDTAHPWWRSSKSGWTVDYDHFKSTDAMRSLAKKAVSTLGLHFAAVDIGQGDDGALYILNVNPTPVLSTHLAFLYGRVIMKWVDNPKAEGEEETLTLPPREAEYYQPPPMPMPQPVYRVATGPRLGEVAVAQQGNENRYRGLIRRDGEAIRFIPGDNPAPAGIFLDPEPDDELADDDDMPAVAEPDVLVAPPPPDPMIVPEALRQAVQRRRDERIVAARDALLAARFRAQRERIIAAGE